MVGLALSYALSVTARLSGVITSFTETEKQMVAVERQSYYITNVPQVQQITIRNFSSRNCNRSSDFVKDLLLSGVEHIFFFW